MQKRSWETVHSHGEDEEDHELIKETLKLRIHLKLDTPVTTKQSCNSVKSGGLEISSLWKKTV